MSDEKQWPLMTAEDVGAVLAGFSVGLIAALRSPKNRTPNEVLDQLAAETEAMANSMPEPGKSALQLTAQMLVLSSTTAEKPERD